jgi:Zn finger protein HypA/HybF involved in hydrogenase expression
MALERERSEVVFGQSVYDGDGNELGRVRNLDDGGFYVTMEAGVSTREQAESKAGEKTLMWRCDECGEVGHIDEVPSMCPSCGASGESISYLQED